MPENNNMQEAVSAFDRAIHLKPDFAEAYYNRGVSHGKLEEYEAAIADYDQAIHLNQDLAQAYSNRGTAKKELKQYEAAIADYDRAIRLKPDYIEYHNRGIANGYLERHTAALADFDQAIRLKSDHANAYFGRGMAKQELGHTKEARDDFKIALDLADRAGDDKLKVQVEQLLQELDNTD